MNKILICTPSVSGTQAVVSELALTRAARTCIREALSQHRPLPVSEKLMKLALEEDNALLSQSLDRAREREAPLPCETSQSFWVDGLTAYEVFTDAVYVGTVKQSSTFRGRWFWEVHGEAHPKFLFKNVDAALKDLRRHYRKQQRHREGYTPQSFCYKVENAIPDEKQVKGVSRCTGLSHLRLYSGSRRIGSVRASGLSAGKFYVRHSEAMGLVTTQYYNSEDEALQVLRAYYWATNSPKQEIVTTASGPKTVPMKKGFGIKKLLRRWLLEGDKVPVNSIG